MPSYSTIRFTINLRILKRDCNNMPNITLNRFMIFNSSEGQDESREADKLLYHWTRDSENHEVETREQIDDICLCDATINVTKRLNCDTFLPGNNASTNKTTSIESHDEKHSLTLSFEQTLILIVEVEPEESIWIAVHVADNCNSDTISEGSQTTISQSISDRQHTPLDPSNIPADAVKRVVINIYNRFCLLYGSFKIIRKSVTEEDCRDRSKDETNEIVREKLRLKCREFCNPLLPEIHLNSLLSNLASLYNNILYLDLNPLTLMRVNSFVNHLVCINAIKIRHTIMIFNDKLLWSSLNRDNTRLVYNYLVSSLIKDALQEELSREVDKVRRIAGEKPIYLRDEDQLSSDDQNYQLEIYYLIVFRSSNNLTLGLMLSQPGEKDLLQKCEHFLTSDSRLGVVPLASLAQSVGQNFIRANAPGGSGGAVGGQSQASAELRRASSGVKVPSDLKYIVMNKIEASISLDSMLLAGIESTNNRRFRLMRYLTEIEPDLAEIERQTGSRVEEFFAKTSSDSWLTVTNSPFKSIYSTNKVRNSSLSEAQQTANNLKILLT